MKAQRKALIEELLRTLAPHLTSVLPADQKLGRGLQKTIHQLADQLLRARFKQRKQAAQVVSNKSLVAQQLTESLTAALDAHLREPEYSGRKATQTIAESAEHLAHKLVKIKHKQEKKSFQSDVLSTLDTSLPTVIPAPESSQQPAVKAKRPSQRARPQQPPTIT